MVLNLVTYSPSVSSLKSAKDVMERSLLGISVCCKCTVFFHQHIQHAVHLYCGHVIEVQDLSCELENFVVNVI